MFHVANSFVHDSVSAMVNNNNKPSLHMMLMTRKEGRKFAHPWQPAKVNVDDKNLCPICIFVEDETVYRCICSPGIAAICNRFNTSLQVQ